MNPYYQNSYNNKLLNQFKTHVNQPSQRPFMNNPMVSSNPNCSVKDPNFYNKIQMAKIEQIRRAKNISDLGMDKKQLSEYIIDPIKIDKTTQDELNGKLRDAEPMYIIPVQSQSQSKSGRYEDQSNAYLRELWKNRTNQPYKNVIKKEMFNNDYKKYYKEDIFKKDINNRDELIVHKVIKNIDADEDILEAEYLLIQEILDNHNGELKTIYSTSNENKYKKEFEYAQKYRYRLEYNPKDSEELKDFYKKEQKKINKEKKMLEQIIDMLVEDDELTSEQTDKLNKELHKTKKKGEIKNLEDELREELGDDFDDVIDAIELENDKEHEPNKKQRVKTTIVKAPRKKITVKTTVIKPEPTSEVIAEVTDDVKEFYKNRKK
jgi:hypothetical protein